MKIDFKSHVFCDKKKFEFIQIDKDKNYQELNKFFKIKINTLELKKRIKFILGLMCDFSCEVSIKICDTSEMLSTNSHFRKKKYPTDVLSFPNTTLSMEGGAAYLGDILICLPVCIYPLYKKKLHLRHDDFSHALSAELEKMIVHGLVHLKGFDHERGDSAWRVMSALEKAIHVEITQTLTSPTWCSIIELNF